MGNNKKRGSKDIKLSVSDKNYGLTLEDKTKLHGLMEIHCGDISFEENFSKLLQEGYTNLNDVLFASWLVYDSYLHKIIDQFDNKLTAYTDEYIRDDSYFSDEIISAKHDMKIGVDYFLHKFRLAEYKLINTYHEFLVSLYTNEMPTSNATMQVLKDMLTKELSKMYDLVKKIDKQTENPQIIPDYITQMINGGFLLPDGKTVQKNLPDVAIEYCKLTGRDVTYKSLQKMFLKKDGKPFSDTACRQAVSAVGHQ